MLRPSPAVFTSTISPSPSAKGNSTPGLSVTTTLDEHSVNILNHESRVHYFCVMKNITFSADERLIELARDEAKNRKTTLNQLFRNWLEDIAARDERRSKASEAYEKLAA